MGCSSSKKIVWKREAANTSYVPVSRCVSAPIHYPAPGDEETWHLVSLRSSSYAIQKMESPADLAEPSSFTQAMEKFSENGITCRKGNNSGSVSENSNGSTLLKFGPVKELLENDGDMEAINTWELMEGLDGMSWRPPALKESSAARHKILGNRSVQELDSCFAEIGSLMWRKYYRQDGSFSIPNLSFAEIQALKCSPSQPERDMGVHFMPLNSNAEEIIENALDGSTSPYRNSLIAQRGADGPLFDPSMITMFEQAVNPANHCVIRSPNEASMRTKSSSSSSNNHTWTSSDMSSDAESSLWDAGNAIRKAHVFDRKACGSSNNLNYIENCKTLALESFDLKCPFRGELKVVLFFTSLRGIRKTYEDCCDMRAILQGYEVHVDKRDVWMHGKFREELTELLGSKKVQVPRLFIKGRYIGGFEEVKRLHEDGTLMRLLEGLPTFGPSRDVCGGCADVRFVPCIACSGSCKLLTEKDEVARCPDCNENGLIMCPICSS